MDQDNPEDKEVKEKSAESTKNTKKAKKAKSVSLLKKVSILLGVVFLSVALFLGYLGFVPGLSSLMGANNPKDLGVTYSMADFDSFMAKTKSSILDYANAPTDPERPGKKTIFADPVALDIQLTQEEITARINESNWAYMPVNNVQVRFGENNKIEVSGNIDIDSLERFIPFIGGVGYSQDDVDTGLSWLRRLAGNPSFYIDSVGSIFDNRLSLDISSVQIGRWSAPLDEARKVLTTATENALAGTAGLDVSTASFSNGLFDFSGTAPSIIYVKQR